MDDLHITMNQKIADLEREVRDLETFAFVVYNSYLLKDQRDIISMIADNCNINFESVHI
jgi:hypothetical protein